MKNSAKNYIDHLYKNEFDGYIQILEINKGNVVIKNYKSDKLEEIALEYKGKKDIYITPNTFYKPFRETDNIRQFRALYIDLDCEKYDKKCAFYELFDRVNLGKIPRPTLVTDSGRGLHIYWRIEHAPSQAMYTWQALEDMLYYNLKDLGADRRATDSARVLRLPGTKNSKTNTIAKVVYNKENLSYSMRELKELYLEKKEKKELNKAKKVHHKIINNVFFNSYSLHYARFQDLEKLAELRNYRLKNYRNTFMHIYTYLLGIYVRDRETLENRVIEFNQKLKEPLKENEIKSIVKSTSKQIEKYIDYVNRLGNGDIEKVAKGKKDKPGYWYKNQTLIEILDITEYEQTFLKTIISATEKYNRYNNKRTKRNHLGNTKKEQELIDLKEKIKVLRQKNYSIREIAKELNISKSKAHRLSKEE